jgi:ABC-type glycerol-3-phosphate transport system permease component
LGYDDPILRQCLQCDYHPDFLRNRCSGRIVRSRRYGWLFPFQLLSEGYAPLAKSVISVIGLYYFVGHWNDFFSAILYITRENLKPLQIILRSILLLSQTFEAGAGLGGPIPWALEYAAQIRYGVIIVSSVPIFCIYPFVQRYFLKGIMISAII